MTVPFEGGCKCGAVRYTCTAEPMAAVHCQCRDCQKDSGSGHASHLMVPKPALAISGYPSFYDYAADSGNTVTRGFCGVCGVWVYSQNSCMPDALFPTAGSLDDPEIFKPQMVVFASRATSWDYLDPELPRMAEMPDAAGGGK